MRTRRARGPAAASVTSALPTRWRGRWHTGHYVQFVSASSSSSIAAAVSNATTRRATLSGRIATVVSTVAAITGATPHNITISHAAVRESTTRGDAIRNGQFAGGDLRAAPAPPAEPNTAKNRQTSGTARLSRRGAATLKWSVKPAVSSSRSSHRQRQSAVACRNHRMTTARVQGGSSEHGHSSDGRSPQTGGAGTTQNCRQARMRDGGKASAGARVATARAGRRLNVNAATGRAHPDRRPPPRTRPAPARPTRRDRR